MYCLVQIQNQQFDSFVFTCTEPVNSKFTIWHPFKCNDDGGFRSSLIYSYVCLSIQMSVCPSVDLSIRLPACLNPYCGQTVPCRIKINSNKGRSLDKELSENGNVGRDDTCFPCREIQLFMCRLLQLAIYGKLGFIIKLEFKTNILSNRFL